MRSVLSLPQGRPALLPALALLAILALAAWLRLSRLDLVEFKNDEATMLNLAVAFLEGEPLPLTGIASSTVLATTPVMVYLMALPMALARDAMLATAVVGAANVLAVFLCYRLGARYFGQRVAVVAALLYATGFWPVIFSRKIWDVSLVPLFGLLCVSALLGVIVQGRAASLLWAFLWLNLVVQFHWSALAMVPFFALSLLLFWRRISWPFLAGGIGLFVLPLLPYLYWQYQNGFAPLRSVLELGSASARYDLTALQFATLLLADTHFQSLLGVSSAHLLAEAPSLPWMKDLLNALLALGTLLLLWEGLRRFRRRYEGDNAKYLLLLLWFGVPVLFFLRHAYPIYVHYLIQVYPSQFLIIGFAVARLLALPPALGHLLGGRMSQMFPRAFGPGLAVVLSALLLLHAGSQVALFERFLGWADSQDTFRGFGVPLRHSLRVQERLQALRSPGDSQPVYIAADEDFASVFFFLTWRRFPVVEMDQELALVLPSNPQQPITYLVTSDATPVSAFLRQHFPEARAERIEYPGGRDAFSIYRLPPQAYQVALNLPGLEKRSLTFGNGVRLNGHALSAELWPGAPLAVTLSWTVTQPPQGNPRPSYRFFNHLVDEVGRLVGQYDGIGYEATQWREGDTVVNWFTIPVAETARQGRYWLDLGMYDLETLQRVAIVTGDPRGPRDSLRLGPLRLRSPASKLREEAIPHRQRTLLGEEIVLLGYELQPSHPGPGTGVTLRLYWRAQVAPKEDYKVFVHLLDEEDKIMAQHDGVPLGGAYPTSAWEVGEIIQDEYRFTLPAAGGRRLSLVTGMYHPQSLERLPVQGAPGALSDRRILLAELALP